ncbi:hypothetical protein FDZ74_02550, partial [bacterium]
MNKMLLVLKNEFKTVVFRKSFFLTLFLVPIIASVVFAIFGTMGDSQPTSAIGKLISPPEEIKLEGLVDESGLIKTIPQDMGKYLIRYQDENAASAALQAGEIGSYYVIQPDFLSTGDITYMRTDFN